MNLIKMSHKRNFGEVGFSASSGIKLNANSSVSTDAFGDITTVVQGSSGTVLTSNGTVLPPTYQPVSINLSTVTGTLPVANGGTGQTLSTGTGPVVLQNSPTIVNPVIQDPTVNNIPNLTNGSNYSMVLNQSNGNVGYTTTTGSGAAVFGTGPSLSTATLNNTTFTGSNSTANLQVTSLSANEIVATDGSSNLVSAAVTGTGSLVLSSNPTIATPSISAPTFTATPLQSNTWFAVTQNTSNGAIGHAGITGTGNIVADTSPTLNTPTLITPTITGTITASSLTNSQIVGTNGSDQLVSVPVLGSGTSVVKATTMSGTGTAVLFQTSPTVNTPTITAPTITSTSLQTGSWFAVTQNSSTGVVGHGGITGTGNIVADTSPTINTATLTSPTISGTITTSGLTNNEVVATNGSDQLVSITNSTSGFVLTSNGGSSLPTFQIAPTSTYSYKLPTLQFFTTAGTPGYSAPIGAKYIKVTLVGGGGGGGSATTGSTGTGGGGGAGGALIFYLAAPVGSQSIQIGASGTASTGTGQGGFGGSTLWVAGSTTYACTGGAGGFDAPFSVSLILNGTGGGGGAAAFTGVTPPTFMKYIGSQGGTASGGQSIFSGSGGYVQNQSTTATIAGTSGCGGSGSTAMGVVGQNTPSAGGAGVIIVEEFYN